MRVRPVAYAIRSSYTTRPSVANWLTSFVFQGAVPGGAWQPLDRHSGVEELGQSEGYFVGFVQSTEWFRRFRILQTAPSHRGHLSFSIGALEIHGDVWRDESKTINWNAEGGECECCTVF
jgi:hypothetical protein